MRRIFHFLFLATVVVLATVVCSPEVGAVLLEDSMAGFSFEYGQSWTREDWTERVRNTNLSNSDVIAYYTFGLVTGLSDAELLIVVRSRSGDDTLSLLKENVISSPTVGSISVDGRLGTLLKGRKYGTSDGLMVAVVAFESKSYEIRMKGSNDALFSQLLSAFVFKPGFLDVWGHPHESAILDVTEAGLVSGYSDGTFQPDKAINRAEFVKMLVLSGDGVTPGFMNEWYDRQVSGKEYEYIQFYDVPVELWFSPYVLYAYHKGWVSGYSDGNFRPDAEVNYAEAMKMIVFRSDELTDSSAVPWFLPFATVMDAQNIVDLNEDSTKFSFSGFEVWHQFGDALSRAGMAQFLYRYRLLDRNPLMETFGVPQMNRLEPPDFDFGDVFWSLRGVPFVSDVVVRQVGFATDFRVYDVIEQSGEDLSLAVFRIFSKKYDMGDVSVDEWSYLGENGSSIYYVEYPLCTITKCIEIQVEMRETVGVRE